MLLRILPGREWLSRTLQVGKDAVRGAPTIRLLAALTAEHQGLSR